jgi:hypothetical protein
MPDIWCLLVWWFRREYHVRASAALARRVRVFENRRGVDEVVHVERVALEIIRNAA